MKQGSAIRADDIDHRVEGRCNVIASREEGDEWKKDCSFHENRVRPRGKEDRVEEARWEGCRRSISGGSHCANSQVRGETEHS